MKKESKKIIKTWDNQADFWTKNICNGMDVFADLYNIPAFMSFIGNIKNKLVLDVGCGEGKNTRNFARFGARVIGIDASENMLRHAQKEETKRPLGIEYKKVSWSSLSSLFKNASFDIVVSTMALMYGPGYEEALQEFYRVLKSKGELFFSIIHPCFLPPGYINLTNKHGIPTHRVISNYFKEGPWKFTWSMSKNADKSDAQDFTSLSYHRTLSTYINNLITAGFVLKQIEEPCPYCPIIFICACG